MRFIILILILLISSSQANRQNSFEDSKEIIVNEFRRDDSVHKEKEIEEEIDIQKISKVINHPIEIDNSNSINIDQTVSLKKETKKLLDIDLNKETINSFTFEKLENTNQKTNIEQEFNSNSISNKNTFKNENKQQVEDINETSYNMNYNENKEKINKSQLSSVTYYSQDNNSFDKPLIINKFDKSYVGKDNIKYYEKPSFNSYNQSNENYVNSDYFQTRDKKEFPLNTNNNSLNNPSIMTSIYSNYQTPVFHENKETLLYDQSPYSENKNNILTDENSFIKYPMNREQSIIKYPNQNYQQETNDNHLFIENNKFPLIEQTNYNPALQNRLIINTTHQQTQDKFYPVNEVPFNNHLYDQEMPNINNYTDIINLLKKNTIHSKLMSKAISFIEKRKLELKERNTYLINKLNDDQNLIYEQISMK